MVKGKLIRCLARYDGCKDRDLDIDCVFLPGKHQFSASRA